MTCKQCFGDQTIWRRDSNGKAVEVACSCVDSPTITGSIVVTGATDIVLPAPTTVTPTARPAFEELKEGDVVWVPLVCLPNKTGRHQAFSVNGLRPVTSFVMLDGREYDALPHCPASSDDRYRVRVSPEEQPKAAEMVHWWDGDSWLSSNGSCMPVRCVWRYQPPSPPEQP